jgi:sulfite reductase alpha subunit-like flavoprotein
MSIIGCCKKLFIFLPTSTMGNSSAKNYPVIQEPVYGFEKPRPKKETHNTPQEAIEAEQAKNQEEILAGFTNVLELKDLSSLSLERLKNLSPKEIETIFGPIDKCSFRGNKREIGKEETLIKYNQFEIRGSYGGIDFVNTKTNYSTGMSF